MRSPWAPSSVVVDTHRPSPCQEAVETAARSDLWTATARCGDGRPWGRGPATVAGMYVETVVQVNDRDTYQASVRLAAR